MALRQACAWLGEKQGGALLLISARAWEFQADLTINLAKNALFCHSLSLGLKDNRGLKALALQGGGGYLEINELKQILPFLNSSLQNALAPGRLFIATHAQDNTPLNLALSLTRQNHNEASRDILSNRWLQLSPGGYGLDWSHTTPLPQPGILPQRVRVDGDDAILNLGGNGQASFSSQDGQGVELNWPLALAEVNSGKLLLNRRHTPFSLTLPAGEYRVYITASPQLYEWQFNLAAGQTVEKIFGPAARLLVRVSGPGYSQARVSFTLTPWGESSPSLRGQSGRHLTVPPGRYWLELQTIPLAREILDIRPQARLEFTFPPLGILKISQEANIPPRAFEIYRLGENTLLGRGRENQDIFLQAGEYALYWPASRKRLEVEILPGQINIQRGP
jgi:hypothetical protein